MTAITATPKTVRSHLMMVEIEEESGYRHWSEPMYQPALSLWVSRALRFGASFSDSDCASTCWCVKG